jgi:hypothetical protein
VEEALHRALPQGMEVGGGEVDAEVDADEDDAEEDNGGGGALKRQLGIDSIHGDGAGAGEYITAAQTASQAAADDLTALAIQKNVILAEEAELLAGGGGASASAKKGLTIKLPAKKSPAAGRRCRRRCRCRCRCLRRKRRRLRRLLGER